MAVADIAMDILRVTTLPEVGKPGALYIYRNATSGDIELVVADKDTGVLGKSLNREAVMRFADGRDHHTLYSVSGS